MKVNYKYYYYQHMILDRTWNKRRQTLSISYIDNNGRRKLQETKYNVIPSWIFDEDGKYTNWDGRRISPTNHDPAIYKPSEFDILEVMYKSELYNEYKALRFPRLYTCDIETEISDEFPDPNIAAQAVTTISMAADDLSVIVLGTKAFSESDMELFKQRYINYISENEFAVKHYDLTKIRVLYQYFNSEIAMLEHFFTKMLNKVEVLAGWNFYAFDWIYLTNRLKVLYGETNDNYDTGKFPNWRRTMSSASPTFELVSEKCLDNKGNEFRILVPAHVPIIDYMSLVKKYDRVLDFPESLSLDWIAHASVNAHKIKYSGNLKTLYTDDYGTYVFYNAVDSLLIQLIHRRLKTLEVIYAYSCYTLCGLLRCMSPVALTTAMVFEDFYNQNRHVVYEERNIGRKEDFEGGYVKEPVVGLHEWMVCDDFASLYPSQIQTCNLSFENFLYGDEEILADGTKVTLPWSPERLKELQNDPNYFVSVLGHVYKNDKDYSFKRIQKNCKKARDAHKYRGQLLESELLHGINGIDARIKQLKEKL